MIFTVAIAALLYSIVCAAVGFFIGIGYALKNMPPDKRVP